MRSRIFPFDGTSLHWAFRRPYYIRDIPAQWIDRCWLNTGCHLTGFARGGPDAANIKRQPGLHDKRVMLSVFRSSGAGLVIDPHGCRPRGPNGLGWPMLVTEQANAMRARNGSIRNWWSPAPRRP
jgi:hypothetical protein